MWKDREKWGGRTIVELGVVILAIGAVGYAVHQHRERMKWARWGYANLSGGSFGFIESIERFKRGSFFNNVEGMPLVRTTIDIDDALWRIVRIRAEREDKSLPEALEQILREFIEDHGVKYGYPIEKIKGG